MLLAYVDESYDDETYWMVALVVPESEMRSWSDPGLTDTRVGGSSSFA